MSKRREFEVHELTPLILNIRACKPIDVYLNYMVFRCAGSECMS